MQMRDLTSVGLLSSSLEINANTLGPRNTKEISVVYGFTKKFAVSPGYGE